MAKERSGGGGRRAARERDTDAEEAMADVAAEVADTSEALDGVEQASRSAAALPDGLLQRRLDKTTADKEKANAEKEKAIYWSWQRQKSAALWMFPSLRPPIRFEFASALIFGLRVM